MSDILYDYTKGRIFSSDFKIVNEINLLVGLKYPWDYITKIKPIHSDSELIDEDEDKILFFTGDSKRIQYLEMMSKLFKGHSCERCGSDMMKFPWDYNNKYMGLCDKCSDSMESEYGPDMFGIYPKKENEEELWWL